MLTFLEVAHMVDAFKRPVATLNHVLEGKKDDYQVVRAAN